MSKKSPEKQSPRQAVDILAAHAVAAVFPNPQE